MTAPLAFANHGGSWGAAHAAALMYTFEVIRQPYGWAVRFGPGMTAPFRLRAAAIEEAQCLCEALRRHGVTARVLVEDSEEASPASAGWFDPHRGFSVPRSFRNA